MLEALRPLRLPPASTRRRQLLVAVVAASVAVAVRWAADPWLGDRHEFVSAYVAAALATWVATWRAGALTAALFYVAGEMLFGAARSPADATRLHALLATLSYWAVCAAVVFVVQQARQVQEELRQRVARLDEADHRKSDFMALLAHELRNPLSVLSNGTELIRQGRLDQRALDGTWQAVERQTAHMKRLVGDLLDTSRVEQGKLALAQQTVAIAPLLTDAVADAEAFIAPRRQHIQLALTPRPGLAHLDPQRIRQVLDNLLHNASKFSPDGSLIHVSLTTTPTDLTVTVSDSGTGIPAAQLHTIFDSFVQLGSAGERAQGLGLGLALCRKLVELHGGAIEARSGGHGCGAEFIVRLPRPAGMAEPAPGSVPPVQQGAPTQSSTDAPPGRRKVLVVDDNADAAESLATLLDLAGYETAVASNGRLALERALAQQPDVVLLDMCLPDMSGLELAARLRQALDGTCPPMVGVSGMDLGNRPLPADLSAYVVKPFEFKDIRAALAACEAQPH